MKITVKYEASWRNSFLDPSTSNNEPLPKTGRKFIGSMTNLKKPENYIPREVSNDTVMGVLNRLIGDQRKLYQARESENYYFKAIEPSVTFEDKPDTISSEIVYIRNITGSTDQNSYTGMVRVNDPIFSSDYSQELWSVLALDFDELCQFVNEGEICNKTKADAALEAFNILSEQFDKFKGLNGKSQILPISMYCSSLYLQLNLLSEKYNVESAKTKSGGLSGISNNGFTKKDFMSKYTSGDKKKIWGNPYMREEYIKGEGREMKLLTKASGKLEISLEIDQQQAKQLKTDIECAGVSSFYLGKKGLAYVSDIRI